MWPRDPQTFPELESLDFTIPQRSRLYRPAPKGAEAGQIEGQLSYLVRLARAHSVNPRRLVRTVFASDNMAIRQLKYAGFFVRHAGTINGLGKYAELFCEETGQLTGASFLRHMSLLPLKELLPPNGAGLLASKPRWCPCCVGEMVASGEDVYRPLAWSFDLYRVCARHRIRLQDTCGHCGRAQPFTALPGSWPLRPLRGNACQRRTTESILTAGSLGLQGHHRYCATFASPGWDRYRKRIRRVLEAGGCAFLGREPGGVLRAHRYAAVGIEGVAVGRGAADVAATLVRLLRAGHHAEQAAPRAGGHPVVHAGHLASCSGETLWQGRASLAGCPGKTQAGKGPGRHHQQSRRCQVVTGGGEVAWSHPILLEILVSGCICFHTGQARIREKGEDGNSRAVRTGRGGGGRAIDA